jgi:Flp pilus assembly protein TadD
VPELRSIHGLWRIWTELGATQQYYPLLHSAFWLEHRLWGDSYLGYHLANVVFHSASACLLLLILRRLAVPGAMLAALIFALHPIAVESVAWISEQKNTLSAMFYLAAAYGYLRAQETAGTAVVVPTFRSADSRLAFALFICALLTKTVTATLPAALLVVAWWERGRLDWRRDVRPLVPWLAASAIAGVFTAWFERTIIGAAGENFALTLGDRVLLAGRILWFYLGKMLWPQNLIFIYPRWQIDASIWWQYLFPVAALILAAGLVVYSRRHRGPLAGFLYFAGTLVPALGFVDVYPFLFSYVADHFQYLASLGVVVPIAASLAVVANRLDAKARRAAAVLGAALITLLAVATWNRAGAYRDADTLYRDTVARNPGAWMAYLNLGTELAARKRLSEAIDAYEGALRAKPDYTIAKNNLVLAHRKLGDVASASPATASDAIAHYDAILRIDPNDFGAHYNLGTLLMDIPGREADSIRHLESAVNLQPASVEAHVNLGVMLADTPLRARDAAAHLEFALARRPDLAPVRDILNRLNSMRPSPR